MQVEDRLNLTLRTHQLEEKAWVLQRVAERLHEWFVDLNEVFFEQALPVPFLTFEVTRHLELGHYCWGFNDAGARHELNINPVHLGRLPEVVVASVLLHEMMHEWQHLLGKAPGRGSGNYHNQAFRRRMECLGVPCTARGEQLPLEPGPFCEWVAAKGLHLYETLLGEPVAIEIPGSLDQFPPGQNLPRRRSPKLRRWFCGCDRTGVSVLVAAGMELQARCARCGEKFRV